MNTKAFFALQREDGEQATLAGPAQDGKGETGSFGIVRDRGSGSVVIDTPTRYAQVAREQNDPKSETFTPVTIKQVQDAVSLAQEPVNINNHVTVVARVASVDVQKTRTSLMLDDCISRIPAVYITTLDQDMPPANYVIQTGTGIKKGVWIRVNGLVHLMDGCYKIAIIRMRPVLDDDEVVFHRLNAVKAHLIRADQGEV